MADSAIMDEKTFNLINDPNVTFYLIATPELKRLIDANEHPTIKLLKDLTKAQLLSGEALVLDKQDVLDFLSNKLPEHHHFLLKMGEIRVVGTPTITLPEQNKGT